MMFVVVTKSINVKNHKFDAKKIWSFLDNCAGDVDEFPTEAEARKAYDNWTQTEGILGDWVEYYELAEFTDDEYTILNCTNIDEICSKEKNL